MAYTFTEKKRIRKDFGKRSSVLEAPYLLAIQLDSYRKFLQTGTKVADLKDQGLQAAFKSVFPPAPGSSRSSTAAGDLVPCISACGARTAAANSARRCGLARPASRLSPAARSPRFSVSFERSPQPSAPARAVRRLPVPGPWVLRRLLYFL